MKVSDFMSSPVYTVNSGRSVQYASGLMNDLGIGSLVVEDYGKTTGIITCRDIRSTHPNRIVADAMTPNPVGIAPDQFAWDALKTMEHHCIERLLVFHEDRTIGIITKDMLLIKLSQLIDPLTGLYRSPYIQQIGQLLLNRRQWFTLLFIDLDNFGDINKEYGHPLGDDILIGFANRLRSAVQEQDYLCRYAGDEFVVITFREESKAARLADALSENMVIHNVKVSASVGLANNKLVPDFFDVPIRELISKASLVSTSMKQSSAS